MTEKDPQPGLTPMDISREPDSMNGADTPTSSPARYSGQPDDLHDLFGSTANFTANEEDDPLAALRNDPNYSALIRDLEYIASQARLLFAPAEEAPSDEVWSKIQSKLTEDPAAER